MVTRKDQAVFVFRRRWGRRLCGWGRWCLVRPLVRPLGRRLMDVSAEVGCQPWGCWRCTRSSQSECELLKAIEDGR